LELLHTGEGMNVSRPYKQRPRLRVQFPKRNLPPLRRACLSLGLEVNAQPGTNLAWLLRKAKLGKTAMEYLRFSDDVQAHQIVARFDSLNSTERKAVTIDYLIMATGADVHHIWGVIQEELSRMDGLVVAMAASQKSLGVLKKTVENALTTGGHEDRKLFFQIAGNIPSPPKSGFARFHRVRGH
jgi:hypothetical protein